MLDHTADVGVRAYGATLEEAFAEAVRGMARLLAEPEQEGVEVRREVVVEEGDLEALLAALLEEVLYLFEVEEFVPTDVEEVQVSPVAGRAAARLRGYIRGENFRPGVAMIKAVTYHQLRVERGEGGWVAQAFFDV